MFGVLASSSGDPPDYLASPGAWIWSALLVRDPDQEASFYQKVFDYEVFDAESDALKNPKDHHTLVSYKPPMSGHNDQFIFRFRKPAN